jgi:PIN domain nuclease of toxin-antitoxin system
LTESSSAVLDASALLAYLLREAGWEVVRDAIAEGAHISAANYAEALARISDAGRDPVVLHQLLTEQGLIGDALSVIALTVEDAVVAARLRAATRRHGLSLGDRCCLATAERLGLPAVTADRTWSELTVSIPIRQIRESDDTSTNG